jgi:hypothetical protein
LVNRLVTQKPDGKKQKKEKCFPFCKKPREPGAWGMRDRKGRVLFI